MGVGLMPLEFKDCLTDSPAFRENLSKHEKELEKTSQQIKRLIKEVKDLLSAAKNLSRAQRTLSNSLRNFTFECIGSSQTEDEKVISQSLEQFGLLIARIEEERENMLERASEQIVLPLEKFRKERIGDVKEGKKKFDKKSTKFCQIQEKTINLSTRKQDNVLLEADASLGMAERDFCQASLEYVFRLQEVQERKKFEFVETLLGFMYGWLTFYHQGHEVAKDFKPFMSDLQLRIQKTRENFNETHDKTESLMKKMMEIRQAEYKSEYARVGYLFLMEKRAFNTHWTKQYCMYSKSTKQFKMIAFNQLTGKPAADTDSMTLTSCVRRMSDTIEKRFCFDLMSDERPGVVYTLQALSESDRKAWMDVMDGKEPTYAVQGKVSKPEECLDDIGFTFVTRCIEILESRGLEELGLYRVTGVASKVNKLLSMGLDRRKVEERVGLLNSLEDGLEWESKTITSALKTYLRTLREPIMTHRYHNGFIAAAKQESRDQRICDVHTLVHRIPKQNFEMLDIVIKHLTNVAAKSVKNLMTVSNLAVCFGPTLLRPEEETVASIMDIKFYNVVVEMLIDNYELIFKILPEEQDKNSPNADTRSYNPNHSSSLDSPVSLSDQSSPLGSGSPSAPSGTPPAPQRNSLAHTARYQNVPNVTHAVIRSYDIEPMSSSLHNVAALNEPRANGIAYLMSHSEHVSRSDHITRTDMNNRMIMAPHRINPATVAAYSEGNLHKMQAHSPKNKHLPYSGLLNERADVFNSTSSSNESMSSGSSRELGGHGVHHSNNIQYSSGVSPQKNRRGVAPLPSHYPAGYRSPATISSIFGASSSGRASPHSPVPSVRRVRTLYACLGENDGELSFEPNQIITNVKSSLEPGWLEGTLNGKTGLVPENYVEMLQ